MESLEDKLNYKFKNSLLLAEALTHPSLAYETQKPHFDNQRLEFLGDSVIQLTLTTMIYQSFPSYDEGEMTKLRSKMVSKEALHNFAKEIELHQFMLMGKGEKASGGQHRASTLADGLEAVIGAVYLDSDFLTVFDIVKNIIGDTILEVDQNPQYRNPKGQLQEVLQAVKPVSPNYEVTGEDGPDHDKTFTVILIWDGEELSSGFGSSKKLAEIDAAEKALHLKPWTK